MSVGKMIRWSIAAATLVAVATPVATFTRPAAAASQVNPLALKKFDEGKAAYEKKEYDVALVAFTASLELLPSPNTRLYIGRCQRQLGKTASAHASLELAANEAHDRLATTGEKRFAATEETARKEAAELASQVPHLALVLPAPLPEGFVLSIDAVNVPTTALASSMDLDPGKHVVVATAPGHTDFSFNVFLSAGESKSLTVEMTRTAAARLLLKFSTKPSGLSVKLDGKPIEPSELAKPFTVTPGEHTITVQAPGHDDFTWKGVVADLDDKLVDVRLAPTVVAAPVVEPAREGPAPWMTFAAAGVGVAAIGIGSVFAMQAQSLSDEEKAKPRNDRTEEERSRVGDLSVRANIFFVGGGVMLVGAGVLALTTEWFKPEPKAGAQAKFQPLLSPGLMGAMVGGSF